MAITCAASRITREPDSSAELPSRATRTAPPRVSREMTPHRLINAAVERVISIDSQRPEIRALTRARSRTSHRCRAAAQIPYYRFGE